MGIQVTWGRAGQSGSLYDFDVCQGGQNTDKEKSDVGATGDAVLKMTSTLPAGKNHKVFADNFFTKGRGSLDFRVNQEDNIIVRWFDNKAVNLLSSFVGIEPLGNAKHWARKAKTYIMVPRPAIVDTYNRFMGGVDLPDMLSSLYKFSFRSRRLVQLHLVALINAWIRYRRDLENLQPNPCPSEGFRLLLALSSPEATPTPPWKRKSTEMPPGVRRDGLDHVPTWETRQRCKHCVGHFAHVYCGKCKVHLCLNKDRSCFEAYHHAK